MALSGIRIRELRVASHLTHDEVAERIGMKGAGSLVAAWEEGRAVCESPLAELVLRALASVADSVDALQGDAERTWKRAGNWIETWRQTAAHSMGPVDIARDQFLGLFPGAEIPPPQHVHGFPFLDHGLPSNVYGLNGSWHGTIPPETGPPSYLWLLDRRASFLYREKIWEDDKSSVTGGHIHIGSLLEIVASTVFFIRSLAERLQLRAEQEYRISLVMAAMKDRGVVGQSSSAPPWASHVDPPEKRSSVDQVRGENVAAVSRIRDNPLSVVYDVVGETIMGLRPDLATSQALESQLRRRHQHDQDSSGGLRFLGFLDSILATKMRRGVVAVSGRTAGVIEETTRGSRFTYDPAYLQSPTARPIAPTLPLQSRPYEHQGLLPFFANLLPEGSQRDRVAQRHKLSRDDAFGLLLAGGADAIGAVEISATGP